MLKQSIMEKEYIESFKFSKKLGQNFLIDEKVKERINFFIRSFLLTNSNILEIGPGIGAITKLLLVDHNVIVIEIDERIIQYWNQQKINNLTVIHGDCLNLSFNKYITNNDLIFSNTPYAITTAMIDKFITTWNTNQAIFLMQKEVADRILANVNNKKYSAYSVYVQTFLNLKKLMDVSNKAFIPQPKVISTLVHLEKRVSDDIDKLKYWKFVSHAFSMRRKTLFNNLKSICNEQTIIEIAKMLNITKDSKIRAQELSFNEFIRMFKIYEQNS